MLLAEHRAGIRQNVKLASPTVMPDMCPAFACGRHARSGMVRTWRGESRVRPLAWVGASREDLRRFSEEAKDELGYGLFLAQVGEKHPGAKPLKGFRGAGVLERRSPGTESRPPEESST